MHTLLITCGLLFMSPAEPLELASSAPVVRTSNPWERMYPMLKWDRPWEVRADGYYSLAPPAPFPEQTFGQWHNSLSTPGRHSGSLPVP